MDIDRWNLVDLVQKITGLSKNKVFNAVMKIEKNN